MLTVYICSKERSQMHKFGRNQIIDFKLQSIEISCIKDCVNCTSVSCTSG